ncbi:hypothetical protein V6N11_056481 [Hibiscus sabdariffa]|uniref:Uncharacterized protein n=1 Tax=Hibiscus sabdariffa TaxID=183260 RepID=A0ABR2T3Y1_9ROSI
MGNRRRRDSPPIRRRTHYTVNLEDFCFGVEHFKVKLPLDNLQTENGGEVVGLKSDGQDAEHDSESDRGR